MTDKNNNKVVLPREPLKHPFNEELMAELEAEGKRLPSAAELYYLTEVVCGRSKPSEDNVTQPSACTLPDRNGTVIEGLHSGVWEWTTTRPGGPFSGVTYSPTMGDFTNLRMIGCGDRSTVEDFGLSTTGLKWRPQTSTATVLGESPQVAARGVRSAKPRVRREDFVRLVTPQ